jgi:endonuclease/exonuclease/phosphatase (EEP) superfamily protein YafD
VPSEPSGWRTAALRLCGIVLLIGALLRVVADRTDLGTLFLYAPRAWLIAPIVAVLFLMRGRLWLTIGVVVSIAYLKLVAGLEWPSASRTDSRPSLRVVTWNTDAVPFIATSMRAALARWNMDAVVLLDCTATLADALRAVPGLQVRSTRNYCFATPHEIDTVQLLSSPRGVGRFGHAARIRFTRTSRGEAPASVDIIALHLASPRVALARALRLDFSELEEDRYWRQVESQRIRRWLDDIGRDPGVPLIVAGDFNLPPDSHVLHRDWGDFRNAFSDAGWGFGYTMFSGPFAVRIDHILHTPNLRAVRTRVERGYPSEHQPLIADLAWVRSRSRYASSRTTAYPHGVTP